MIAPKQNSLAYTVVYWGYHTQFALLHILERFLFELCSFTLFYQTLISTAPATLTNWSGTNFEIFDLDASRCTPMTTDLVTKDDTSSNEAYLSKSGKSRQYRQNFIKNPRKKSHKMTSKIRQHRQQSPTTGLGWGVAPHPTPTPTTRNTHPLVTTRSL